jgi:N-acetylneuraminic acid mutarotase
MPKFTAEGVSGAIAGKLYVLAGQCDSDHWPRAGSCEYVNTRKLFRYDPSTNTWATRQPAPHVHRSAAAGVINGKFYVAGGIGTRTLDVYDPTTNTWKTLASIPRSGAASGTVLGGKLFVIVETSAYTYNPRNNTWSTRAAPEFAHDAVVRVRINSNPFLVALGGNHGAGPATPNPTELYTP